jgi:hypothetical protein
MKITMWHVIGLACGYPKCCISNFVAHIEQSIPPGIRYSQEPQVWRSTGYVPCPEHYLELMGKDMDYLLNLIPSLDPDYNAEDHRVWAMLDKYPERVKDLAEIGVNLDDLARILTDRPAVQRGIAVFDS